MTPQPSAPIEIGRVFATFDFSAEAEGWLETQSAWFAEDGGRLFLREYSTPWAAELINALSDELRELNLPIRVELARTVDGSLLHIVKLIWDAAETAWPYVQAGSEAVGATEVLVKAGRSVKRRLRRRANIDAHNATQPSSPPPPQVIIEVHVVVEVRHVIEVRHVNP